MEVIQLNLSEEVVWGINYGLGGDEKVTLDCERLTLP